MNISKSSRNLLLLSKNEETLLDLIQKNKTITPASASKECSIPRPTIYITLDTLQKRKLVQSRKIGKRKVWEMVSSDALREHIDGLKDLVVDEKLNYQKINIGGDTDVTIHRGHKTLYKLFMKLIEKHGGNRLMGVQGDFAGESWQHVFAPEDINVINNKIKEVGMITEIITSKDWFNRQINIFGSEWAEAFVGRAAQIHFIENKYLNYESQIFLFQDQLYLVSMKEQVFIEIKNKQVTKLIISLIKFVEDHSSSVDINKILKNIQQ